MKMLQKEGCSSCGNKIDDHSYKLRDLLYACHNFNVMECGFTIRFHYN